LIVATLTILTLDPYTAKEYHEETLRKEAHKLAHFYSIWGAEVLLDEDCAGCQGLCGGVGDSEKAALGLDAKAGSSAEAVAKAGMKEMSYNVQRDGSAAICASRRDGRK